MDSGKLSRLGIGALILAWSFDLLFWGKAVGISFPIFVLLCLIIGIFFSWRGGIRPAVGSAVLGAAVLLFAWVPFVRQEAFTVATSIALTLFGMAVLSFTWQGGRWWRYDLGDYGANLLRWLGHTLSKPAAVFFRKNKSQEPGPSEEASKEEAPAEGGIVSDGQSLGRKTALSILLGLLLALPILCILSSLLALADPAFSQLLEDALRLFEIENLGEYIFRLAYILVLAYLLSGALLYALLASKDEIVHGDGEPRLRPFFGWLEASTIFASVDVLFAVFVGVQVRYFFGGRANIQIGGYTYAEYARRGFGELLLVAVLSLLLVWGLSVITRREKGRPRWTFSVLGVFLVGMVGVMLVSAYQRLLLYEAAYGFTRLRIYTHVFMIWLGVLLAAFAVLEAAGKARWFALALVLVNAGFGGTLALMNVDGTIVRQNLARAIRGEVLDTSTLVGLSEDAAPSLLMAFESAQTPEGMREVLGGVLACRAAIAADTAGERPWQAFNLARHRALRLYREHEDQLAAFQAAREDWQWIVDVGGLERECYTDWAYRVR